MKAKSPPWTIAIQFSDGKTFRPLQVPLNYTVDDIRFVVIENAFFTRVKPFQDKPEVLD